MFPFICISSRENVMHGEHLEVWWQYLSCFSFGMAGIWAKKTLKSANTYLRASLVDLKRLRSSYWVIWAGMLMYRVIFLKDFGITKLLLFVHGMLYGLLDCLLHSLGRVCHHLTILFHVQLVRSGLRHERSNYISSQGRLFFSWTDEGGNIFLSLL